MAYLHQLQQQSRNPKSRYTCRKRTSRTCHYSVVKREMVVGLHVRAEVDCSFLPAKLTKATGQVQLGPAVER